MLTSTMFSTSHPVMESSFTPPQFIPSLQRLNLDVVHFCGGVSGILLIKSKSMMMVGPSLPIFMENRLIFSMGTGCVKTRFSSSVPGRSFQYMRAFWRILSGMCISLSKIGRGIRGLPQGNGFDQGQVKACHFVVTAPAALFSRSQSSRCPRIR